VRELRRLEKQERQLVPSFACGSLEVAVRVGESLPKRRALVAENLARLNGDGP
jgi:hypothetical protein